MAPASRGTLAATAPDPRRVYEYPTELGDILPAGALLVAPFN